jgi:sulfatase modifying factor 1
VGGASAYGVLDMAGNVVEWVADWYSDSYYATSPANNPTGPPTGMYKVERGGAWLDYWWGVRVAYRLYRSPTIAPYFIGFRCAKDAPGG